MPVYHFNVRDGSNIPDADGTDLPNISSARLEAVKLAGRLLLDRLGTFWEGSDWHVEVTIAARRSSGSISRPPTQLQRGPVPGTSGLSG
jgi:hypothetical protein